MNVKQILYNTNTDVYQHHHHQIRTVAQANVAYSPKTLQPSLLVFAILGHDIRLASLEFDFLSKCSLQRSLQLLTRHLS